jgi:hypothetical protein
MGQDIAEYGGVFKLQMDLYNLVKNALYTHLQSAVVSEEWDYLSMVKAIVEMQFGFCFDRVQSNCNLFTNRIIAGRKADVVKCLAVVELKQAFHPQPMKLGFKTRKK